MATKETTSLPADAASAIDAANSALLDALVMTGALSALLEKLQEEVQAHPGCANGLLDAAELCVDRMHGVVAPAQEALNRLAGRKEVSHG